MVFGLSLPLLGNNTVVMLKAGWATDSCLMVRGYITHILSKVKTFFAPSQQYFCILEHTHTYTHLHPENFFLVVFQLLGWDKSFLIYFLVLLTDHICVLLLSSHLLSLPIVEWERKDAEADYKGLILARSALFLYTSVASPKWPNTLGHSLHIYTYYSQIVFFVEMNRVQSVLKIGQRWSLYTTVKFLKHC